MTRRLIPLVAVLFAVVTPACGASAAAAIDGHSIAIDDLEAELKAMRSNAAYVAYIEGKQGSIGPRAFSEEAAPVLTADVLTVQITAAVVREEFEKRKIDVTAADRAAGRDEATAFAGRPSIFASFPRWYRTELINRASARAALRRHLRKGVSPEEYYKRNRAEFLKPCTSDLVVGTFEEASAARQRILGGESFADVARDVSLDSGSGPKGGDLGCNGSDGLHPELTRAALTQKLGAVGEPIKRPEGYHLLLVRSRETPRFAEIDGEVRGAVAKLGAARLDAILARRFESADVEVADEYGNWDGRRVVPSVAGATPKPRPLPPVAASSKDVDPSFHVGQEMFLTDGGFVPKNLTSIVDETITFINEDDETREIAFGAFDWKPLRLKPGARGTVRPTGAWAIVCYDAADPAVNAFIQVEPYFEPGEDPAAENRFDADSPGESSRPTAPAG